MSNEYCKAIDWGGRRLTIKTGKVGRQADATTVVSYGDTIVMCSVTAKKKCDPSLGFFPLTVHYQERAYAAGKIHVGFFKHEAKPTEKETIVSRLIDRSIRPLFANEFKNETNVICTVLSYDMENNPDIVAMIAASSALMLSGLPFNGPIGVAHVAQIDGSYVLNPVKEIVMSGMDLVVAGTVDGILMVDGQINELSEDVVLNAIKFGHKQFQPVIDAIFDVKKACYKEPIAYVPASLTKMFYLKLHELVSMEEETLIAAYKTDRVERIALIDAFWTEVLSKKMVESGFETEEEVKAGFKYFKNFERNVVRAWVLKTSSRIDRRGPLDIRPIVAEVGVGLLPRVHGCALFTRGETGETQALVVTTLRLEDVQIMDVLEGKAKQHFMLDYNLGPGRREIGHGKLAWHSIYPVLPSSKDFPYTFRVVSEITASNGPSSMATVCGTSLALMDAGVPIKRHVAGIAMGVVKEGDKYIILSDISGDEYHIGDIDFKVAGTCKGITSLQMDIKITDFIRFDIMEKALIQARESRLAILDRMNSVISSPREKLGEHVPTIRSIKVSIDKIPSLEAGIPEIVKVTGAAVHIDGDTVQVSGSRGECEIAIIAIGRITFDVEVGVDYIGVIKSIKDFGIFVEFAAGHSGLIHVSKLIDKNLKQSVGDEITVKIISIDDRGRIRLAQI